MANPTPFYELRLEDYAAPNCWTTYRRYFGTQEQILRLLGYRKNEEFLEAAQAYFAGTGDGTACMFGHREQILFPVEQLGSVPFQIDDLTAKRPNLLRKPYRFHAKKVKGELHYFRREDGECIRAHQDVFTDLRWLGRDDPDITELRFPFMGYPHMLYHKNGKLTSRLLLPDRCFDSQEEALADMAHPAKLSFVSFFSEIVRY